ncbi:hypothetical protein TPHA_0A01720 [Tetrapisispora phaffii CBS 4417]|uniref:DNA polymerase epsilon subunit D n=1 Tax=Tetrapisispora phaffii (strain ATCC 24235 / CBS 4417 / NBRC 1672 / NRRL Y-8282 / UCD 70-5) TaxID=1071381 RepID=G8BMX7_TETPH|nr:hypothetical protein TPHA_0A01720 [Tetrapisispora phaffii CBS 4417]CCE61255.1 hypothetical protein TPHA_0A01720 [Tetrapisispora phaffii CBS 4417]
MPPKGWKKDSEGKYPTTSYVKEQENVTIQDLLFPRSVAVSLAKEGANSILGPGVSEQDVDVANVDEEQVGESDAPKKTKSNSVMINKDASLAVQRSATVFVNHLLMFARDMAKQKGRKSCNADDVMEALEVIGYAGFKPMIREKLDDFQSIQTLRKQRKTPSNPQGDEQGGEQEQEQETNSQTIEIDEQETKKLKTDTDE